MFYRPDHETDEAAIASRNPANNLAAIIKQLGGIIERAGGVLIDGYRVHAGIHQPPLVP